MTKSPAKHSKRSPFKAGYVKKFQKIRDDKVRKLLKRSKIMIRDAHTEQGQGNRSYRNKHARRKLISPKGRRRNAKRWTNSSQTTEESLSQNKNRCDEKVRADSDDDCILVEQSATHITIEDNDSDDDMHSTPADSTSGYHLLFQSFPHRLSSTPCAKSSKSVSSSANANCSNAHDGIHNKQWSNKNHNSNAISSYNPNAINRNPIPDSAPFFVDVSEKSFIGNIYYNTVAPLRETSESDDVVILDKSTINGENSTLKEIIDTEPSEEEDENDKDDTEDGEVTDSDDDVVDDSVVFISETNPTDFISLNGTAAGKPAVTKPPKAPVAPKSSHLYSELFTRTEKKQLEAYNSNAYNPNAGEVFTSKKRMVIIDGSNVAFKHSLDKEFSVRGLQIAIEYFEKMGHEVKAVVPQFRMNNYKSSNPQEMDKLHKSGKIVQTPCKNLPGLTSTSYDDRFILQLASELDAAVVSNDNYRDLLHENPAFRKIIETRVIGYTWCNDIFILPKDPYGKWGPTLDIILNRS